VDVQRFESELMEYVAARANNIFVELVSKGELSDSLRDTLHQTIRDFKAGFRASDAPAAAAEEGGPHMRDTEDAVTGQSYRPEAEAAESGS
jgi:hypothetical protein